MTIQNFERLKERVEKAEKMIIDLYDRLDNHTQDTEAHHA